jgi:uncharacterized protein (DUF362 family)
MEKSSVYVYKTSPTTLESDINRVLRSTDFQQLDPEKETFIKINANYDRDWPGCNTSNWFLDALLKNLKTLGFNNLTVIEGDLKLQPAAKTIKALGIDEILKKYDISFLPIEELPREGELPTILKNAQIISTPVLHTHTFAVISVASKNLYGLLPVYREKYHHMLSDKLLELAGNVKVFSIVDGTVGLDGGSMRLGSRKRTDLIMAGWNPISIDVIAAKIMGFSYEKIPHLNLASRKDLINSISIKGDFSENDLPVHNFEYNHSKISGLDLWIRRNKITRGLFEYNSLLDRFGNHIRRAYTTFAYYKNINAIMDGDWKEYKNEYEKRFE